MARSTHQDYIARIRYSNVLPPPPNPPKLLDIPGTGMQEEYTTAGYAAKLAREQELNIEADGELGMPIDLVGIPGVFEGDDSALYGLSTPPAPHPHDKPLLRPLHALGKSAHATTGVSFLRRTEYISNDAGRMKISDTATRQTPKKRKASEAERDDDPVRMLRGIYKGFDTAYPSDAYHGPDTGDKLRGDAVNSQEATAWERPRHPNDPELTPLDTYPILPDLDGMNDAGAFFVIKYTTNPVVESDKYDKRLDVAILRPREPYPGATEKLEAELQAHAADPSLPEPKPFDHNYDLYLPEEGRNANAMQVASDPHNSRNDDEELYEHTNPETGRKTFSFHYQRLYETYNASQHRDDPWGESVAVALHDPSEDGSTETRKLQKAAYIYPIVQRSVIRPRRKANMGGFASQADGEDHSDVFDVWVRDPNDGEMERRTGHRKQLEDITSHAAEQSQDATNGHASHDAVGDLDEEVGT